MVISLDPVGVPSKGPTTNNPCPPLGALPRFLKAAILPAATYTESFGGITVPGKKVKDTPPP